jgi:hypothetical protein
MAVTVVCPMCDEHGRGRVVMRLMTERPTGHDFECPTCGTYRHVTKDKTGGTPGSGTPAVRGSHFGGFGPGTATFRGKRDGTTTHS